MSNSHSILGKATQYLHYRTVFQSHGDIAAYRRVRNHPEQCSGPVAVRVRGIHQPLACRPGTMDAITLWDAFSVAYHLPVKPLPTPPAVILDLGANAGYTAASFARQYPEARIVAVEMDADNAAMCRRNLTQFGSRVEVVHAAIWTSSGSITYGGGNVHDLAIGAGSRSAPAITIDDLLSRRGIAAVDYVKMDIEGAERSVLETPTWISSIGQLSLEIHPPATFEWCRDVLREQGFACARHPQHPAGLVAVRP